MARHWFGQTPTDWTLTLGDATTEEGVTTAPALASGPAEITFWNAATGGSQHDDLLDESATPIATVTSSDGSGTLPVGTVPRFQGPDDVTAMWADAGGGVRYLMIATDLSDTVDGLVFDQAWIDDMQALLADGATGQYLGKDPTPDSALGIRWSTPPSGSGSGSGMWVDVTQGPYAADRTGTEDARPAIQAAIDDVWANGGGIVYLPRGTYLIGYVADVGGLGVAGGLQLRDNVWVRGEGVATRLEPTGTWATDAGLIGIGDAATTRAVRDTRVSDLWCKGTPGTAHAEPVEHVHGPLYNTAGIATEPDAVHRIHDVHLWDLDRGLTIIGTDDQAMFVQRIRGRWFRRQAVLAGSEAGSGGPDNYFAFIDVSSANRLAGGTYAGIEVRATNTHWVDCKVWYCKRGTAFVEGSEYKDGAGWFVDGVRNTFVACEAQDNGGHGFVLDSGKVALTGCSADSNNNIANISGSAAAHECSGFYIGANELTIGEAISFDRNSTADDRYQKYGYAIDAGTRNVQLQGVAYDNRSSGVAADPADGVAWIGGAAHTTHEVRVQSLYGSSRTTIASGVGAGRVDVRQDASTQTITGTTLTTINQLVASVPGGSRYYRVEAVIWYRADAVTNARIGLRTDRDGASGSVDLDWQAQFVKPDGTAGVEYSRSQVGTTRYIVADGDGAVASNGYANQRSCLITGTMFAGSTVGEATVSLQVAEDGGTDTGTRVIVNSTLSLTPLDVT